MLYSRPCWSLNLCSFYGADAQTFDQMIADAEGIGHDGQRGVNGGAGREEAPVHDIEIVDLVSFAICVQRGRLGITPEADGAVLVCHAGQWNAVANEEIPCEQSLMTLVAMNAAFGLL